MKVSLWREESKMDFAKWIDTFCPPLSGERLGLKTYNKALRIESKIKNLL